MEMWAVWLWALLCPKEVKNRLAALPATLLKLPWTLVALHPPIAMPQAHGDSRAADKIESPGEEQHSEKFKKGSRLREVLSQVSRFSRIFH